MGMEVTVGSLDELCDLMCNNKVPREKKCWYIFTFGCDQPNAGKYVKVFGTYGGARKKMHDKYGDKWAFQYSEEEWNGYLNDPDRTWDMETELEVIK